MSLGLTETSPHNIIFAMKGIFKHSRLSELWYMMCEELFTQLKCSIQNDNFYVLLHIKEGTSRFICTYVGISYPCLARPGGGCEVLFSPGLSVDIDLKFIQDTNRVVLNSQIGQRSRSRGRYIAFLKVQSYHKN